MSSLISNRLRVAAALLTALALLTGVAIVAAQGTTSKPADRLPLPNTKAPVTSLAPAVAQSYPVFARAQSAADIPQAGIVGQYALSRGGEASLARLAMRTTNGEALYVIPANGATCLASSDSIVHGCGPFPLVTANQLIGGTAVCAPGLPAGFMEIAGLIAGSASSVALHFSDGSTREFPVQGGVFAAMVRRAQPVPVSVTWTGPSGAERADTGTPPDAASGTCA